MAYATQSDVSPGIITARQLVQLTDDTNSGEVNTDVVTEKLNQASGTVEMYCRNRYKLPLQPTAELTGITAAIAAYLLFGRRSSQIPETVKDGYTNAMSMLRDVASEKAGLDQPGPGATEQSAAGKIAVSRRKRPITDHSLEGFTG